MHFFLSEKTLSRLIPSAIAIIIFIVFLPSLENGFVNWDDDVSFLNNPYYRGLGWEQLKWMWTSPFFGHYVPLTWMTYGLDYILWGMDPFGYHFTSLVLHTLNGVIFYFLVIQLFRVTHSDLFQKDKIIFLISAGVAALLFAIHPLRVESVVWASQRRDVLSGFFALLTLITYLKYCSLKERLKHNSHRDGRDFKLYQRWYFICFLLFIATLLSRGNNATLIGVFILLDIYPLKRLSGNPLEWLASPVRHIWLEKTPFVITGLVAGALMVGIGLESYGFADNPYEKPLTFRLAQASLGLTFHIEKTIIPTKLSPVYVGEMPFDPSRWENILCGIFIILFVSFFIINRKRWPTGLAAFTLFFIMLFPTLGVAVSPSITFDHYSYLACLGWAVLGGAGFYYISQSYQNKKIKRPLFLFSVAVSISFLMILGSLAWKQVHVWENSETLWAQAVHADPQSVTANGNLTLVLIKQKRFNEAMEYYKKVYRFYTKTRWSAYQVIGERLLEEGGLEETYHFFKLALEFQPSDAAAHYNAGIILFNNGKINEAIEFFEKTIKIDPEFKKVYRKLGNAYFSLGKPGKALEYYKKAFKHKPGSEDI